MDILFKDSNIRQNINNLKNYINKQYNCTCLILEDKVTLKDYDSVMMKHLI